MYQYVLTLFLLGVCTYTDIRYRKVYGKAIALYSVLALAGNLLRSPVVWTDVVCGAVPGAACMVVSWISRQGLGYGDSILILACGMTLVIRVCISFVVTAFLLAGIWDGILFIFRKADRRREFPFVPFLLMALLMQGTGG